jgi:hypothetical protein
VDERQRQNDPASMGSQHRRCLARHKCG